MFEKRPYLIGIDLAISIFKQGQGLTLLSKAGSFRKLNFKEEAKHSRR